MKRIAAFVAIVTVAVVGFMMTGVDSAAAADYGVAGSLDDLMAVRYLVKRKVSDYNSTKEGTQWIGLLSFCVCAADRSKIIWASDLSLSGGADGGQLISRCRDAAQRKCRACTGKPALEIIR